MKFQNLFGKKGKESTLFTKDFFTFLLAFSLIILASFAFIAFSATGETGLATGDSL